MKKYSILIVLLLSLFVELYFERQFPYITIILVMFLGGLFYYIENVKSANKGLEVSVSTLYHVVKYLSALWLVMVYIVYIDKIIDHYRLIHYIVLLIIALSLVVLDLFDILKWYKSKYTIQKTESHLTR